MDFENSSQNVSLQQFSDQLQNTSSRSSLGPEQDQFRRILQKRSDSTKIQEMSQQELRPYSRRSSDACELQNQNLNSVEAGDHHAKELRSVCDENRFCEPPSNIIKLGGPTNWLSNASLRSEQSQSCGIEADGRKWCGCLEGSQCMHCTSTSHHTTVTPSPPSLPNSTTYATWLSMPVSEGLHHVQQHQGSTAELVDGISNEILQNKKQFQGSVDRSSHSPRQGKALQVDLHQHASNSHDLVDDEAVENEDHSSIWENVRLKAEIVSHPLYDQLLTAHVACLRTATPVDQLSKIDAQLVHASHVAAKYSVLVHDHDFLTREDKDELNQFMTQYVMLLHSFKEQLQQHVRVHAMEAVVACWEMEQSLHNLTGVTPGEGTGATMSDDEDEHLDNDVAFYDTGMDGHDSMGFGPLIPTETERTLMERVRHELKLELKQGYRARINDVREEILRKRRAGKLPGDTTSVLKAWWHAHSKWPYPSEDEKARLVQETGLELKQINNWFINQRKRNWNSNPSASSSLKNKRKS
uniref:Transcription factor class II KNOX2-2 n=1 Tax=Huperzia selago TaxID=70001 RepID=A0A286QXT1_HUPSE|nr:transcription factor class II KNOX2-2 [Huperzia selago]